MKKDTHKRKEFLETLRSLKGEEFQARLRDESEQLFWSTYKKQTSPGEKSISVRSARRNYARLLTVKREAELKASKEGAQK